jgi:hypothetical protein
MSRRRLLGALTGLGAAGAFAGYGTAAFLGDGETVAAVLAAGEIDLSIECAGDACDVAGATVRLAIDDLRQGACGGADLRLRVESNPAWIWLRTDLTDGLPGVRDLLYVGLRYGDGSPVRDAAGRPVEGSLREVHAALADGVLLDGDRSIPDVGPLAAGRSLDLRLRWGLATVLGGESVPLDCGAVGSAGDLDASPVDLGLDFFAGQRRHDDSPVSPWRPVGVSGVAEPCLGCRFLGKLELETPYVEADNRLRAGRSYPLRDPDGAPAGYSLLVRRVEDDSDGDETETIGLRSVSLVADGAPDATAGPRICRIEIGAGPASDPGGSRPRGGSPNSTPDSTYDVCPPATTVDGEFDAPGGRAISNVSVYACGAIPPTCV